MVASFKRIYKEKFLCYLAIENLMNLYWLWLWRLEDSFVLKLCREYSNIDMISRIPVSDKLMSKLQKTFIWILREKFLSCSGIENLMNTYWLWLWHLLKINFVVKWCWEYMNIGRICINLNEFYKVFLPFQFKRFGHVFVIFLWFR